MSTTAVCPVASTLPTGSLGVVSGNLVLSGEAASVQNSNENLGAAASSSSSSSTSSKKADAPPKAKSAAKRGK